jgi:hypothetical protein
MSNQTRHTPQSPLSTSSEPRTQNVPLTFDQVVSSERAAIGGNELDWSALCISGGGMRSAIFALGAIQGLAELGVLENFDYLSTVSSGSHISAWLTAWKQREGSLKAITKLLKPQAGGVPTMVDPIRSLRDTSDYFSRKSNWFSMDTWLLPILQNIFLNWLVFVPFLIFILMIPRVVLSSSVLSEKWQSYALPTQYFTNLGCVILPSLAGMWFAVGVFACLSYLPGLGNKNYTRSQLAQYCLSPLFIAALAVLIFYAWYTDVGEAEPRAIGFATLFSWTIISGLGGWLVYCLYNIQCLSRKWKTVIGMTPVLLFISFVAASTASLLASSYFRHLSWPVYVTLSLPLLLGSVVLALMLIAGFTSFILSRRARQWVTDMVSGLLVGIIWWFVVSMLVLVVPPFIFSMHGRLAVWFDVASTALAGGMIWIVIKSSSRSGQQSEETPDQLALGLGRVLDTAAKMSGRIGPIIELFRSVILKAAPWLATPLLSVAILVFVTGLTNWLIWQSGMSGMIRGDWRFHRSLLENTRVEDAVIIAILGLVVSWLMGRWININKFSLQAMYQASLVEAYIGASNVNNNGFTHSEQDDDLAMSELNPALKPFPVINATVNIETTGSRQDRVHRQTGCFTFSPLQCGSSDLGYRPTRGYGGKVGISLGTAMAVSGVLPDRNKFRYSSPLAASLMTLFSARLGMWLGNPKNPVTWLDEGPRSAADTLVRESVRLLDESSPYIYLSDGGHFENLGLYGMIQRRCRYIVALDGSNDPNCRYEDLANAVRRIRIDMNIIVEFETASLELVRKQKKRCAIAKIHYKELDPSLEDGYVLYIKPVVIGNEPTDVTSYKLSNEDFPYEKQADAWFSESQIESYRLLGLCSIREIFNTYHSSEGLRALFNAAYAYVSAAN